MPEHDWRRMTEAERAEALERVRKRDERRKGGVLWFFGVNFDEADHHARKCRIQELLQRAVEIAGVEYDDAVEEWIVSGIPKNPEKSASGYAYYIYSQAVLDAFRALGGEAEFPNHRK